MSVRVARRGRTGKCGAWFPTQDQDVPIKAAFSGKATPKMPKRRAGQSQIMVGLEGRMHWPFHQPESKWVRDRSLIRTRRARPLGNSLRFPGAPYSANSTRPTVRRTRGNAPLKPRPIPHSGRKQGGRFPKNGWGGRTCRHGDPCIKRSATIRPNLGTVCHRTLVA